jgi:hypothetical protein
MFGKIRVSRWLLGALFLAVLEWGGLIAVEIAISTPAQAQFWNDWTSSRRPARQRSGGFFQNLFGNPDSAPYPTEQSGEPRHQAPADYSRAPAPRKPDAKAEPVAPTTSIVVMGDGMADWLAYGLEDAFSDTPEVAIVRKDKPHSGLLRYDPKDDLDWWHVARDLLAQEKANYVVMMLGVSDRQNIRERDLAKEAAKEEQDKKSDAAANPDQAPPAGKPEAADAKAKKKPNGVVEFQSEQWERIYTRRIDDTIAALKSKGVPVFWVGLPPIRGTKSTAETSYLNNLYRQRAERAGVVYIDVWDGFVDENGKFTTFGPDYEGQKRRLRSGDGVYFTKYGARKLAHYVERELRRYMSSRIVALPTSPAGPTPEPGKPAQRPLAGPVVPLTVTTSTTDELLGGAPTGRVHGDAVAAQVLLKGAPLSPQRGRADDFAWPPGSEPKVEPVAAPATVAPPVTKSQAPDPAAAATAVAPPPPVSAPTPASAARGAPPVVPAGQAPAPVIAAPPELPTPAEQTNAAVEPKAAEPKAVEPKPVVSKPTAAKPAPKTREAEAERRRIEHAPPRPPRNVQQRPSNEPFGRGGLFGLFR